VIPPGLVLTPTRRPPTAARLAFQPKSLSTSQLLLDKGEDPYRRRADTGDKGEDPYRNRADSGDNVLKSWWNRFSNRYRAYTGTFPYENENRKCSLVMNGRNYVPILDFGYQIPPIRIQFHKNVGISFNITCIWSLLATRNMKMLKIFKNSHPVSPGSFHRFIFNL